MSWISWPKNWPNLWDTKHLWTDKVRKDIAAIQPHVPNVDIQWMVKAVLCHFAVGVILGWIVTVLLTERPAPPEESEHDGFLLVRLYNWFCRKLYKLFPWSMNGYAALMAMLCGVASWAPDIDHPLSIPWGHPSGRFLHPVFFVFGAVVGPYAAFCIWQLKKIGVPDKALKPFIAALIVSIAFVAHVVEDFTLSWW